MIFFDLFRNFSAQFFIRFSFGPGSHVLNSLTRYVVVFNNLRLACVTERAAHGVGATTHEMLGVGINEELLDEKQ